jgi:alpha-tubulin suppressor-like RCC1 family protein
VWRAALSKRSVGPRPFSTDASFWNSSSRHIVHCPLGTHREGGFAFNLGNAKRFVGGRRQLWTWGNADHGRGGLGTEADAPIIEECETLPKKVTEPELEASQIQQVALGGAHTLVVTREGDLLSCGLGENGQLGRGDEENYGLLEEALIEGVVSASAGHWHSAAITREGHLYTWGLNKHSQLGLIFPDDEIAANRKHTSLPRRVFALGESKVKEVSCGGFHTIALTEDGSVYTWGYGRDGRLGHGDEEDEALPKRVMKLSGYPIISVHAGIDTSVAISSDGRLWMWGSNCWHQLGLGDKKNRMTPTLIPIAGSVKQVATGAFHTTVLTTSGAVWSMGVSMYGSLGLGDDCHQVVEDPSESRFIPFFTVNHVPFL